MSEIETARVIDPSNPLNQEPFRHCFPQPDDVRWFQGALEKIAGFHSNGRPRFRVVWGASDRWIDGEPEAMDWDLYGKDGDGEWRARYIYSSRCLPVDAGESGQLVQAVKLEWFDIAVPRFFIERYVPPEAVCPDWQAVGVDEEGRRFTDPTPIRGLYEPVFGGMIAEHTAFCCDTARKDNRICYGYYRPPNAQDLENVARGWNAFLAETEQRFENPDDRIERERRNQATRRARAKKDAWFDGLVGKYQDLAVDAVKTHSPMFSSDDSVQRWGKYHFTGGHSKSGTKKEPKISTESTVEND